MRKRTRAIIIIVIIAATVIGILLMRGGNKIETYTVTSTIYTEIVAGVGNVTYAQKVEIKPKESGEIKTIKVVTGDDVLKNALLIELDDKTATLNYESAAVNLELAKARLMDYTATYENNLNSYDKTITAMKNTLNALQKTYDSLLETIDQTEVLYEKGAIAQSELDALLTEKAVQLAQIQAYESQILALSKPVKTKAELEATIKSAENQLSVSEDKLSYYNILAPFDGIILEKLVDRGEYVQTGQSLLTLADPSSKVIKVDLDETYLSKLDIGQPVNLVISAYNTERLKGSILKIEPMVNEETGTVEITIKIMEKPELFLENMSVRVEITTIELEDTVVIPSEYLIIDEGYSVHVVENGNVVRRTVEVLNAKVPNIGVLDGLSEGDLIVNPAETEVGDTL